MDKRKESNQSIKASKRNKNTRQITQKEKKNTHFKEKYRNLFGSYRFFLYICGDCCKDDFYINQYRNLSQKKSKETHHAAKV
ncbi:hypothetical protein HMPREF0658_2122 [Hoylesella marshii DSM 16973 = JCM 13450]|uniref:Uncharacterized protein n=1 Tax=Hoylesella marshii DSM 16973 = JCM 13450 TaxID=862515 RepID=E0NVB7_9BACT|nr:hypothetical protein HMPREF0658_2122 [Hoylesella marshii DSM 16973 = JCM 13450]